MKLRPALVLLFALSAGCVYAQSAADLGAGPKPRKAATWPLEPTAEQAQAAQLSARFLTRFHYDAQPLDDAMSARIYKAYLKMLDGDKVFFTQADMDKFAPLKTKFDDAIWNSDLSAPFAVFNLYVQRAVQRMTYARSLLKDGFDLSRDESYDVDRKDAAWPKDKAAADDLWRKRTKNDWLRLKLAGKDDADIRKTLDKRYSGYIDRIRQINSADAFQTFMNAYAESTDPHTDYLGPEAAANFDIAMSLSLQGIGAQLQSRDDYTMIVKLIAGGPAMKSHKLKPGDRIVAVGQGDKGAMVDVVGWRIDDVTALIRGKKGTVVRLEVLPADVGPDGKHELLTLVRDKINLEDAAASKKVIEIKDGGVTRKIGVIDLPSFYSDFGARSAGDKDFRSTTRDVAKLIAELKQEGVQGIVVDLRNNGGGSLAEADSMTGLFIDKGPVVQVRGSHGEVQVQGDDDAGLSWSGPLAVLVNRGTASASEIFSAAIQDYHRGLVIGEPTFGKGTVQTLVDLDKFASGDSEKPQLGELKMTIQEFFRINGGSTQLKGVTPDIGFPKNGDEKDFGESTYDNALPWTQIPPADYEPVANLSAYLPQLLKQHDQRAAQSPAWKLMLDELAQYKKMRDMTSISLNLATREAERKQQEQMQAAFRARHVAIDGSDAALPEAGSNLDDGLNPNERSIKSELKEEKDAKNAKDPQLEETAHILFDAIGMIKADPKLASEVLPYGGKFSPRALASVSTPAPSASSPAH
ncbi:carboxy terminal-processing peptidase [Rhodanobacter lindaniclasticus]|uniref:Tail-specific protease n=1 Tax=Rhodanobacter lindaniclasticus TaxID=75310 RepID=A0A4S3KBX6_9GAMM|nr:carboxy terminal-processing peptidase [Rhodanobacter lindaniclasticus]THD05890.1 tail-specific protease [Rhodanobacter lindaniclasticus]